ncbi:hypothetical protein BDZ97DRAFT_1922082 [Flammula alnicola]|nr:hypothetical protein BDZ97DRAFT_1922082 [Flammula alnicola]
MGIINHPSKLCRHLLYHRNLLFPFPFTCIPRLLRFLFSTREAKQELVKNPISGLSACRPLFVKSHPLPTAPGLQPTHQRHPMALERSISPISPDLGLQSHSRRDSHEDGEIGKASPPPPSSQRLNPPSPATFIPKSRSFSNLQPPSQSHSPPCPTRTATAYAVE